MDTAFTTNSFLNWKKAEAKFKEHEHCLAQKNALTAFEATNSSPISTQLQKDLDDVQSRHKRSLLNQISCLHYLLRQGIALRNDHEGGSNPTVRLCRLLNKIAWVTDGKY